MLRVCVYHHKEDGVLGEALVAAEDRSVDLAVVEMEGGEQGGVELQPATVVCPCILAEVVIPRVVKVVVGEEDEQLLTVGR